MTTFNPNWDTSWTATSINASTITNTSTSTTSAISNDNIFATEISVQCTYGSGTTSGIVVYIFRDLDGTNFETANDLPWGFQMPYSSSATRNRAFTISSQQCSNFKVYVSNNSGNSVTCTVKYRQCTVDQT